MTWILGLTGGIGSGKSTASAWFADMGYPIVDADQISRALTAPGGAAIEAIRSAFGSDFITANGAMDRAKMRERVFNQPAERVRLEGILRPMIRSACLSALDEARSRAARLGKAFVVFDCPLLLDWTEARSAVDRILVIDLDEAEQIRRVGLRSGLSSERVRSIIAAQIPRAQRLQLAHDIIFNGGSREDLAAALAELVHRLTSEAH